ncbi:MAG: cytochrome c [Pseudomonadota bacterium]
MGKAFGLLLVFCLTPVVASATEAPDGAPPPHRSVAAGFELAKTVCAACHNVAPDGAASPNPRATPFAVLAQTPGMGGEALTVWLTTFHPARTMPPLTLTEAERANIIAYILSLGPNKGAPLDHAAQ